MDTVLKVDGLYKKFCKSLKRSMLYGTQDMARSMLGYSVDNVELRKNEFWALQDINFELKRGETLGLIGQNGCGKTTLLRLINGIFPPDKGRITINGRIGALIAVGAGFHPYMTGRENIYLNGIILGMTKKEIDKKFDEIIDFAEIGDFIDAPVSTYSSGMTVRLGFAIAIHCEPELLLVDEILAVGDLRFQQKCLLKISELKELGSAIIFVSHQMSTVQWICNQCILLNKGFVYKSGKSIEVIGHYYNLNSNNTHNKNEIKKLVSSKNISYRYLNFYNSKNIQTRTFASGEDIFAEWAFDLDFEIIKPHVSFSLFSDDFTYNGYNTLYDNIYVEKINKSTVVKFQLRKPYLSQGLYTISLAITENNGIGHLFWDYETTGTIEIICNQKMHGRFNFDHAWKIEQNNS